MEPKAISGFEEKPIGLPGDQETSAQKPTPKSILKKTPQQEKVEKLAPTVDASGKDEPRETKITWNKSTEVRVIWQKPEDKGIDEESSFQSEKILGAEGVDVSIEAIEGGPSILQRGMKAVSDTVTKATSEIIISPTTLPPDPTTNPDKKAITSPEQIKEVTWIVQSSDAFDHIEFGKISNQDLFSYFKNLTAYRNRLKHKLDHLYSKKGEEFKNTILLAIKKYDRYINKINTAISAKKADFLVDEETWINRQRTLAPDDWIETWSVNDLKRIKASLEERFSTFTTIATLPSDETSKERTDSIFGTYSEMLEKIETTLQKKQLETKVDELETAFEDLERVKLSLQQPDDMAPEELLVILKHTMFVLNQANPIDEDLKAKVEKATIECGVCIEQVSFGPIVDMCNENLVWISEVKENIEQTIEIASDEELETNINTFEQRIAQFQEYLEGLGEDRSPEVRELLQKTLEGYQDLSEMHDAALLKRTVPDIIETFKEREKSLDLETVQSMTVEELEQEYKDYEEGTEGTKEKLEAYISREPELKNLLDELFQTVNSLKGKLKAELEART